MESASVAAGQTGHDDPHHDRDGDHHPHVGEHASSRKRLVRTLGHAVHDNREVTTLCIRGTR